MYEGINLLNIAATCKTKFITALMEILFTPEERKAGIIIETGKKKSRSERTPLDKKRVEHLKSK